MINDDQIDVITNSVKVPEHRELVLAALSALANRSTVKRLSDALPQKLKRWQGFRCVRIANLRVSK